MREKMVAQRNYQRNAATPTGILRRTKEADFEAVADPRNENRIKHPLDGVLELGVLSLTTDARSARDVEDRSGELKEEVDEKIHLDEPISDNAFSLILRRIDPYDLRKALRRTVKAEWTDRENLRPADSFDKSTVAVDGKNLATLHESRLRSLATMHTPLEGCELTVEQLKEVYATHFSEVQLRDDDEAGLIGVVMVHRATLVSSEAALVIDQRSIDGSTSEHGTIEQTLGALFDAYSRTDILERITVDAGNMTRGAAEVMQQQETDYFGALKSAQGNLYERAVDWLGGRGPEEMDQVHLETYNGKTLVYRIWTMKIAEGTLDWEGARQLVRIRRIAVDNTDDEVTDEDRYFVSSESSDALSPLQAYRVARAHWRCENEGHWTADAIWGEDARRTPWTTYPTGIVNVGILRAIAINILALLRSMSRLRRGQTLVTPEWRKVIEYAFDALLHSALEIGEFNTFDN
jgi:predicted transposase YbfD/YdcC